MPNAELIREMDFEESFLKDKLGISNRYISDKNQACSDLAIKAAEKIFEQNHINPSDIGLLILVTQNPDYKLPGTSHIVQDQLGLCDACACFDINLGCSGFVYSLGIAKAVMQIHDLQYGIIITSDPYSKVISSNDRVTRPLFGDAASATLITPSGRVKMLRFTFGSDGSGFRSLIVEAGGSRHPLDPARGDGREVSPSLFMDGRGIFNFIMKRIPEDIRKCLKLNGLTLEEIDCFVFHQASKYLIDHLSRRLKIPHELVEYHMEDIGNTVSSSIPITLSHTLKERPDLNHVLISGFGVGLSWASTVLSIE